MSQRPRETSGEPTTSTVDGSAPLDDSASAGPSKRHDLSPSVNSAQHASSTKRRRLGSISSSSKSKNRSVSPIKGRVNAPTPPRKVPLPRDSSDIPFGSPSSSLATSDQEDESQDAIGVGKGVDQLQVPGLSAGTVESADTLPLTKTAEALLDNHLDPEELAENAGAAGLSTLPVDRSATQAAHEPADDSQHSPADKYLDTYLSNPGQLLTPPTSAQAPALVSTLGAVDDTKVDQIPTPSDAPLPLATPMSVAPTDSLGNGPHDEGEEEIDPDRDMEIDPAPSVPEIPSSLANSRSVSPSRAKPKPKVKSQAKKPATKPPKDVTKAQAPTKGAAKGTTKKAPAKKEKTKVESIKESSKRAGSSASPASESLATSEATTPVNRADSVDSEDDAVYCICRKPYKDEDEDVVMVACDGCDDWFHPGCVKIDEAKLDLLDSYICAKCEKTTTLRTKYKRVCKRERCGKSLTGNGKYCSSACAFRHMAEQVPPTTNKKLLKQLSTFFVGLPAPQSNISVIHHLDTPPPSAIPEQTVTTALSEQISAIDGALLVLSKRQEILQRAIARCETLVLPVAPEAELGDKKNKKRAGGGDDRPCGWDKKLVWTDDELEQWTPTEDDEMDGEVCMSPKRRCDRHQGWQKVTTASLELETAQLARRKGDLERQVRVYEIQLGRAKAAQRAELDFNERISKAKVIA